MAAMKKKTAPKMPAQHARLERMEMSPSKTTRAKAQAAETKMLDKMYAKKKGGK